MSNQRLKELVEWLLKVEALAGELYEGSLELFAEDKRLGTFLRKAVEDEAYHYHVMASSQAHLDKLPDLEPPFKLDGYLREKVEEPFARHVEALRSGRLSEEDLIDCVAQTEFSEWNGIFLYVVGLFKKHVREFKYAAIEMQDHLRMIEGFLEKSPHGAEQLELVKSLEPVWQEKILIVEDDELVAELMSSILSDHGRTDLAVDGMEALKLLQKNYYRLIISDVDMPRLGGLEFFEEAITLYPGIASRFLFVSGGRDHATLNFYTQSGVRHLAKPFGVEALRRAVGEVLNSQAQEKAS